MEKENNKNTSDYEEEEIVNEEDKATGVWKIIKLIEKENLEIFMDENNVVQALIDPAVSKIAELTSETFKSWVLYKCYEHDRKPPNSETITKAVKIIDIKTRMGNPVSKKLFVRVAEEDPDTYWYDLGSQAVRYDKHKWEVKQPPALFRRFSSQRKQVI